MADEPLRQTGRDDLPPRQDSQWEGRNDLRAERDGTTPVLVLGRVAGDERQPGWRQMIESAGIRG